MWTQTTALRFGPTALNEEVAHFEKRKIFILLSTVMTWARSKPLDPVSALLAFLHSELCIPTCPSPASSPASNRAHQL